ncbi:hypothetical protein BGM09_21760 [Streptomyces sp. CBMA29]|nr:hypothetical protein [Streptomyces sp. CBMA29]
MFLMPASEASWRACWAVEAALSLNWAESAASCLAASSLAWALWTAVEAVVWAELASVALRVAARTSSAEGGGTFGFGSS